MSIIGIIAIAFTFGVAILAHEFGHFLLAKILGVGVETFSIGMGKKIFKLKWGETTYCLSAVPFGGYVVLKGALSKELEEHLKEEEKKKDADKEGTPPVEEKSKSLSEMATDDIISLRNKPLIVKIAIYSSGVFMNFIVAIIAFTLIMMVGMETPNPKKPIVGYVAADSLTENMGVRSGDVVLKVNEKPIKYFDDIIERMESLYESNVTTMTIALQRNEKVFDVSIPLAPKSQIFIGFMKYFHPAHPPYIEDVMYNQPADKAGIRPGDYIIQINEEPIGDWYQLVDIIRSSVGKPLRVQVRRGEETLAMVATPTGRADEPDVGQLGILMGDPDKILKRMGFGEALGESINVSFRIMGFVVSHTYKLFARFNMREISDNMGGPVAIAIESYRQARSGLRNYFYFFGAFNIMLLMLNIMPLPILDGGHILFSIIETIIRRPISPKMLLRIYSVMIVVLIGLALLVTFNDIIGNLWRLGIR